MCQKKNKTHSKKNNGIIYWIKRKIVFIITAFMLGISSTMQEEDSFLNNNQNYIEQKQKKE